ncbi:MULTISPECIES: SpvB/TcaC N-terminal domain-containing protein [unclassified Sinorhizobium]|uniref:SpvB/TcaC N-terminal domain-containing protein n=1 Tax=unclassified Sinorhizobium TaxID=2613772 RepID=UPI0024C24BB5|nr:MULTISPECIES: SpvB/TcaC N-terminal domain-containing protein [unclassified Sinorhizobium]MDK1377244.1 SpvB/TcaC N-terminal domain-containing protein [Sinorhizobium sp. 6-70]MDK1478790.1 SpvB/TcaC N-terminal domain-containing protein [Sinorhizobium sp. 6-117]
MNLPSGGGALKGIGEKFSFNNQTGTGTLSIPLPIIQARGDIGPRLELTYDSGSGNGSFGAGWHLTLPSISRKTDKGLPKYDDPEPSDVFIFSGAEDLVPALPVNVQRRDGYEVRRFRPRVESGFALVEWWFHPELPERNHWRVISRDNLTHVFGYSKIARLADPVAPSRVFQWLLECSFDDKGNAVVYRYKSENAEGVDPTRISESHRIEKDGTSLVSGSYLESVLYGNLRPFFADRELNYWRSVESLILPNKDQWQFQIFYDYTARENPADPALENRSWSVRSDPFSTYRAGFEVRTWRLCRRILFVTNISIEREGVEPGYTGITHGLFLVYETGMSTGELGEGPIGSPILTKLKSIQQIHFCKSEDQSSSAGRYKTAEWPPLEFAYSTPGAMSLKRVSRTDAPSLPEGVDGSRFEWVDLDGEGIQGVLSRRQEEWWYSPNRWADSATDPGHPPNSPPSGGTFPQQQPLRLRPAAVAGAQLVDLAGDGLLDVIEYSPHATLMYERSDDRGWRSPKALPQRPAFSLDDPNVRLIDLDGDGRTELLLTEDDCLLWQQGLGEDGFGAIHRVAKLLDERRGPRCVFSEVIQTFFLADMSGDGLTDIVRIRNGDICYWPNLGYGRFGARVVMDNAPAFDIIGQFDPKRIRLVDVDGSGVADIVYLGREEAVFWANQSGNGWSRSQPIPFRIPHSLAGVTTTDFFGRGTGCLVWSSPSPADVGSQFYVVDLTGGVKPHLLTSIRNNLGAETHLSYRSSTEFYLKDLAEGRPWVTRLPFPVHVVEKVETKDIIGRNRFISRYAYHHGFFDGVEREFRGFGLVEQWDTEEIDAISASTTGADNWRSDSYVPPKLTKSWFHHGAWFPNASVRDAFKREYWSGDPDAIDIPDTVLPGGLSIDEEREAGRALRGRMLRQEVFALDADENSPSSTIARASRPYEVTEQNFTVVIVQPRDRNRHAVFLVHPREKIHARYERLEKADPRVSHELTLKVDDFGNVEQSAVIAYGRRQADSTRSYEENNQRLTEDEEIVQGRSLITFTLTSYTNSIDEFPNSWRLPLPAEVRTYEMTDPAWERAKWVDFDTLRDAVAAWNAIPELNYGETAGYTRRERRLIEHGRTLYRANDLRLLLPLGRLESLALSGEALKLAITPSLLGLFERKSEPDQLNASLRAPRAGYAEPDGDGCYWVSSGRTFLAPDASGVPQGAATELAFARKHFFLPHRFVDAFGNATRVAYDDAILRIAELTDSANNTTTAKYEYRLLQPRLLTDPNGNHTAAAFDIRGFVVATAVLGKTPVGEFGDTLEGIRTDPSSSEIERFLADPIASGPYLLARATSRFVYDIMRYYRAVNADKATSPAFSAALERQFHVTLPFADDGAAQHIAGLENFDLSDHIHCRISYSDGFGREIQRKLRTSPRIEDQNPSSVMPPRWLGSGWTIFNNKGQPVRQYEPFFRVDEVGQPAAHAFEFRSREGVSPILFYDPIGRAVATLHPDHSWEKVVFDPWKQVAWDRNDTTLIEPLEDPDVCTFFERLRVEEWPLIEGASPTWNKLRTTASELEKLFPGTTDAAKWRRQKEAAAAQKAADHAGTPIITHFDPQGREFVVVTHNRFVDYRSNKLREEFARTRTLLDIESNRRAVIDPLDRTVMAWEYDLLRRPLRETSMDSGRRWMLPDAASQPMFRWDERDHFFTHIYDELRRPLETWMIKPHGHSADAQQDEICFQRFAYGEDARAPSDRNLRGRVWKHFDTAGVVTFGEYDAKGNLLSSKRRFCRDYKSPPDWSSNPDVEPEEFDSTTDWDAQNRAIRIVTPDGQGSETFRLYNLAGQLFATTVRLETPKAPLFLVGWSRSSMERESFWIVRGVDYNPRGQQRIVQYGNNERGYGLQTTFTYDDKTFRLLSLTTVNKGKGRTEQKYQALDYTYDPVGNVTAIADSAQETLFFKQQAVKPEAEYICDALYRLVSATGREHIGQNLPPNAWDTHRAGIFDGNCTFAAFPNPNDGQAMRNYLQRFVYDPVGNIEEMMHQAGQQGSWRRVYGYEGVAGSREKKSNRLLSVAIGGTTMRYDYDSHGSMISMPHLPQMETDFRDQLCFTSRQLIRCAADRPLSQGEATYYVYDSAGERVRKITERNGRRIAERFYTGLAETYRAYQSNGQDIELERLSLHVLDDNRRFALFETRTKGDDGTAKQLIRSQLPNHLGSACLEVQYDKAAPIISYEEFHPYGTTAYQATNAKIKAAAKRYRFAGKERDEESGLNYHSARYLATWLGRWVSADPEGIGDHLNVYQFVQNNPVTGTDPTGRWTSKDAAVVGAVVAVAVAVTVLTAGVGTVAVAAAASAAGAVGTTGAVATALVGTAAVGAISGGASGVAADFTAQALTRNEGAEFDTARIKAAAAGGAAAGGLLSLIPGVAAARATAQAIRTGSNVAQAVRASSIAAASGGLPRELAVSAVRGGAAGAAGGAIQEGTRQLASGEAESWRNLNVNDIAAASGTGLAFGAGGAVMATSVRQRAILFTSRDTKGPVAVTDEAISAALKGSELETAQISISRPAVERYVRRLEAGEIAPPIKVSGNAIVDGNHRYVAGRLVGREPARTAGTLSPSQHARLQPVEKLKIDPVDWGNR